MRVAICAALALSGLTLPALPQQPVPKAVSVGSVTAERKPIAKTADFVRRVDAINRVDVRARVTGYLEAVQFKEGDFLPLRGMIESVDGQTLLVKAPDGTMTNVKLVDGAHVFTFNKASLVDVKRGSLVGVTAQPQVDSSQKVAEIYIFVDEATHEAWGLPASGLVLGKDAILGYIEGRVLTNDDQTLVIKSNDGEEQLTMPTNVRVVTLVPATVADVKAGQYVLVPISKLVSGGTLASTIIVGSDSVDFAM